jgi:hypothetical protein
MAASQDKLLVEAKIYFAFVGMYFALVHVSS